MPLNGSQTPQDLLDRGQRSLVIACAKCRRSGAQSVQRLIETRGADLKLTDYLVELSADCPLRQAGSFRDQCGAHFEPWRTP